MVGQNNREIVTVKIGAELESLEQIKKIFSSIEEGSAIQLCDGDATLELLTAGNTLSFSGGLNVEFLLSFATSIASGVIGNWIYNAICASIKKLEINGHRTRITEENIAQAIETLKGLALLATDDNHSTENSNEHK